MALIRRIFSGTRAGLSRAHLEVKAMRRNFIIIAAALCAASATVSGCSETYPQLPDLTRMSNVLSPKEQNDTIKTLTGSQASADATAAKQDAGQQ